MTTEGGLPCLGIYSAQNQSIDPFGPGAEAQFSPDVNGTGDSTSGQCQPTATVLRVTAPGGGTFDAPIQPPTPVCEQGSLHFKLFTASS